MVALFHHPTYNGSLVCDRLSDPLGVLPLRDLCVWRVLRLLVDAVSKCCAVAMSVQQQQQQQQYSSRAQQSLAAAFLAVFSPAACPSFQL